MTHATARPSFTLKGWHVLAALVVFFGVIFSVNAYFITVATQSFPGLATDEPFKKGLAKNFNAKIDARADQATRNWRAGVSHDWNAAAQATRMEVFIVDATNTRLEGLTVTGDLGRVVFNETRPLRFQELTPGLYVAQASDIGPGEWALSVQTAFDDGAPFEASKRLWMR